MGTRKISQLDTIADANLSGEAILPVVVSDPLIPNRKAKVNQLFKGVAQGTKAAPGLCFDLDRDTGLYQLEYDQLGLSFGDGGLYLTRSNVNDTTSNITLGSRDEVRENANIILSPKGSGTASITGIFSTQDENFQLTDNTASTTARFEVSAVGTGATRVFSLPTVSQGSTTTLVGSDTTQVITNKTINIDHDNLQVENPIPGTADKDRALFQLNYTDSQGQLRKFFLPDAGATVSVAQPTTTESTLLDTKADQTVLTKTFVQPKFTRNDSVGTEYFQFNTDALTTNRIITIPDLNLTLVGVNTTQTLTAKTIVNLILSDNIDVTKRMTFDLSNINTQTNNSVGFPATDSLNNAGATSILVTEKATQDLSNKTLIRPQIRETASASRYVVIDTTNITAARTIKFPDADATLLSTENVTVDDVNFGAGIGAANLTGRTRLQQFFYAGF